MTNIIQAFESLAQPFEGELKVKESTLRNVSPDFVQSQSVEKDYEDARFPIPSKFIDLRNSSREKFSFGKRVLRLRKWRRRGKIY